MKKERGQLYYESPIGIIQIEGSEDAITQVHFQDGSETRTQKSFAILAECRDQLDAYFKGKLKKFDLPLFLQGTPFQKLVWQALMKIPYGVTVSYSELAASINRPKAVRAVGGANHRNPIAIIIPCHRVIGADGKLVGYGGGLWRKEWLLNHEKSHG